LKRNILVVFVVALTITLLVFSAVMNYRSRKLREMQSPQVTLIPGPAGETAAGSNSLGAPDDSTADLRGKPAPKLKLQSLDGKTVNLADYKGKAVLVNFWATWCAPCKVETPWLIDLRKQYADQGFEILGVAADDAPQNEIADSARKLGMNYPVLLQGLSVENAWGGLDALPTSFYIGRNGKIVEESIGLISRDEIEADIKKALATPAGGA
jgi:thiol-disulfide isomerase/thioredoxin